MTTLYICSNTPRSSGRRIFFWWNVVDSWPFRARLSAPRRLLYIFFATAGLKLVGVLITVSGQVLYTAYLLPRDGTDFSCA